MASEVKLPDLGEGVQSGDVVDVKIAVGDVIQPGQEVLEVEAEKTTLPVPTPVAGTVTEVLVKKGDKVKSGQTIFLVDEETNGHAAPPAPAPSKPAEAPPKAAEKPAAPPEKTAGAPAHAAKAERQAEPVPEGQVVPAGPATRRLAREWGVDLHQVPPGGPRGRITQDDVKGYVRDLAAGGGGGRALKAPPLPDFAKWGPVEHKPFESIRRRTAEHVSLSWGLIPHVTQHDLADVTDIELFRKQQEGKGPKLTVTAFVLKACAILLKEMPQFNSSLDEEHGRLVVKQYYHFNIAVDTDKGLVVPVLRDVDQKSVHEIGKEMSEAAERARTNKLKPEDSQGGTFTISNLGGIGGTGFTPIVNFPQVAILGLSRSRLQPVFKDGAFVPRLLMPLSLSYDHRVIDGADAARFARRLAELLENPMVMLLHA
jgi:pyruvate dehydrogenase E2 component (dihydrolipoamide acetyltransferase)